MVSIQLGKFIFCILKYHKIKKILWLLIISHYGLIFINKLCMSSPNSAVVSIFRNFVVCCSEHKCARRLIMPHISIAHNLQKTGLILVSCGFLQTEK